MEKKYISVDQLWKCETCFYMGSNGKCRSDCDAVESYRPAYSKFEFADVAPVVRCGECIHALKSDQCNPDSRLCNLNLLFWERSEDRESGRILSLGTQKTRRALCEDVQRRFHTAFPGLPETQKRYSNGVQRLYLSYHGEWMQNRQLRYLLDDGNA